MGIIHLRHQDHPNQHPKLDLSKGHFHTVLQDKHRPAQYEAFVSEGSLPTKRTTKQNKADKKQPAVWKAEDFGKQYRGGCIRDENHQHIMQAPELKLNQNQGI